VSKYLVLKLTLKVGLSDDLTFLAISIPDQVGVTALDRTHFPRRKLLWTAHSDTQKSSFSNAL